MATKLPRNVGAFGAVVNPDTAVWQVNSSTQAACLSNRKEAAFLMGENGTEKSGRVHKVCLGGRVSFPGKTLIVNHQPDIVHRVQEALRQLAEALLRPGNGAAVTGQLQAAVPTKPESDIRKRRQKVLQLWEDGCTYKTIAREVGCSVATVRLDCRALGLRRNKPRNANRR